jgi:hypothetical protein
VKRRRPTVAEVEALLDRWLGTAAHWQRAADTEDAYAREHPDRTPFGSGRYLRGLVVSAAECALDLSDSLAGPVPLLLGDLDERERRALALVVPYREKLEQQQAEARAKIAELEARKAAELA